MSTALALIQPTEYDLMAKLATVAAQSGYSKQNQTQALFIMLKGFELGISPMQALDGIQVIQGKTTVSPQLMLALINRSGLLEDLQMDGDSKAYTVTMTRKGRSSHTEVFTIDNAKAMGLAGKDNWLKQPAVMLKWRAVSACARVVFPDVIQGMYTPEEMGAEVSEDASGELVIDQAPLAVLPAPQNVNVSTGEIVEGKTSEMPPESNDKPLSSDLPVENATEVVTPPDSAETAKSRFAGKGAPPAGQKKESSGRWPYDRNQLLSAISPVAKDFPYQERNATVKKLYEEGAFGDCMDIGAAVQLVIARLNAPEHGKGKKSETAPANTEITF